MPSRATRAARCLAALVVLIGATEAGAQERRVPGDVPLEDVLEIVVLERRLLALDAASGGRTEERLEIGETVRWHGGRGRIGVVITDRRLLAVGVDSGAWQEARFRRGEQPPETALLGGRVALALTRIRALGFDGGSGNLVERTLGPREHVLVARADDNVAVVMTDRRALALSPFAGGFFGVRIASGDSFESVSTRSNLATIRTARRLLVFNAASGSWSEQRLELP